MDQWYVNQIFEKDTKGIICLGASRSGTHMITNALFNLSTDPLKIELGEIYNPNWPFDVHNPKELLEAVSKQYSGRFIFCSIVQYRARAVLAKYPDVFKDYTVVNIRRRDKVSQYISWCVFRAQSKASMSKHSPIWEDYKHFIPWESSYDDLELFLVDQLLDYAFTPNFVLYYEDLIYQNLITKFQKMKYPIEHNEIVTDYERVKTVLGDFKYKDDN